jgi:LacI family transcriptional regulator
MTTMRDVARVAGVSAKTVSRVFNEDPHVTEETRERVRWAMQKLNYVPNLLARSFRAGADPAVGLAVPEIGDPFFAEITSSIEIDLVGRGMAVVVSSLGQAAERERSALEALLRRQISGLIVACASADQAYLAPWQNRTPMVFVDRPPRGLSGVYVIEDDLAGAREAVTHLANHGGLPGLFHLHHDHPSTAQGLPVGGGRAGTGGPSRSDLHAQQVSRRMRR